MKKIALVYSGDDSNLTSLEHNRNNVKNRLENIGYWEVDPNTSSLLNEQQFNSDLSGYQNEIIDKLLIYYTGHGTHSGVGNSFKLKLHNNITFSIQNLLDAIFDIFMAEGAKLPKKIAIVIDACHSSKVIFDTGRWENVELLCSSIGESFETIENSNMSWFSHYFCEAMEVLPEKNEVINLGNINTYINSKVTVQESLFSPIVGRLGTMVIAQNTIQPQLMPVSTIYVYVKPDNSKYKFSINQKELFDGESIDIDESSNQTVIIDGIKEYLVYMEINTVELIIPSELFSKDIPSWTDSEGTKLFQDCNVLIRSYQKSNVSKMNRDKLCSRWNQCFSGVKSVNVSSVVIQDSICFDSNRICGIIEKKVTNNIIFKDLDKHYFISIWINQCEDETQYSNILSNISQEQLKDLPRVLNAQVVNNASNCSSNINFMWDNPNTLPKAYYE